MHMSQNLLESFLPNILGNSDPFRFSSILDFVRVDTGVEELDLRSHSSILLPQAEDNVVGEANLTTSIVKLFWSPTWDINLL